MLFVCSGNICRSPMAEAIARHYAESRDRALEVQSAGTLGIEDAPADPHAVTVCSEIDVDLSAHRSQGMSPALVQWADWIPVMTLAHARTVRDWFPEAEDKVVLLGSFGGLMEIADPIGAYRSTFRRVRDEIRTSVQALLDRLPPQKETA